MQNHPNQDADYDTVRAAMQASDEYINVNYPFVQGLVRKHRAARYLIIECEECFFLQTY